MTEQLEDLLRDEFGAASAAAPEVSAAHVAAWARTARARVRDRRRRTAMLAGTGVLAAAVVVPFALPALDRQDRAAVPVTPGPSRPAPSHSAPSRPAPSHSAQATPADPVADGLLQLRGVTVAVPKAMLAPGNRRCGTSLVDAAWWEDRYTGTRSCLVEVPTAGLTEVTLRVAEPGEAVSPGQLRTVLEDGRTAVSVGFPDRNVTLRVLSAQPARAERIAASAQQLPEDGAVLGCAVRDPGRPRPAGRDPDRIAPDPALGGVVCGYRDGWLVDLHPLGRVGATELAKLFNAAPPMISRDRLDCKSPNASANGAWEVALSSAERLSTRLRVDPASCPDASIVTGEGFEASATGGLVEALSGYAQGPVYAWGGKRIEGSQVP